MKITDRELLELAAKAEGIAGEWVEHYGSGDYYYQGNADGIYYEHDGGGYSVWNPLTDDGDRLRLARQLGISIDFADCCAWKRLPDHSLLQEFWGGDCGDEAHAVLRVAAAIGEAMP